MGEVSRAFARGDYQAAYDLLKKRYPTHLATRVYQELLELEPAHRHFRLGEDEHPNGRLTDRELDVLFGASRGETVTEIADRHSVSVETVKSQRATVMRKLEAVSMTHAVGSPTGEVCFRSVRVTDRDRVYALLRSLNDWVPCPRTWTGSMVGRSAKPGLVATSKEQCPACHGEGTVHVSARKPEQTCERCTGAGKIIVDRYDDWLGIETPQAGVRIAPGSAWRKHRDEERRRDEEIRRLARLIGAWHGHEESNAYGWEKAKERQYEAGSYPELDHCLQALRAVRPLAYELVMRTVVSGETTVTEGLSRRVDEVVDALARALPKPIRVPPWLRHQEEQAQARKTSLHYGRTNGHEQQRRSRNTVIWRLRNEGLTLSEIGRRVALQKSQVADILAGMQAAMVASGP